MSALTGKHSELSSIHPDGSTVDISIPVDEVHLPDDVVHLQPGEGLRDEVLAPDGDLRVLVAPVSEAADYPSWGWGTFQRR